ncbi:MAG: AAA family ATPase [Gemmatimonadetes bacterium]|jgi:putative ATPase|nr:AAA family ATPase [Gemmatimonadota bacterium]MBT6143903.1 AAA family ATPase [Gemmatimonadota bacterium]MBT7863747.1 AAA family ATPase [Gemmatimonadota bacterium]
MSDPHGKTERGSLDLFESGRRAANERDQPLAARLRPRTLDEFVGQEHILGPGRLLRRAIQADQISSLLFYGPPGTGKTTLALVIANTTRSHFITINAVLSGVADIRKGIAEAKERRDLHGHRTILFVDEVHRFNKAQQDALLPWVENGTVILIGATTENPYFAVNRPLVSRSRVFQLRSLVDEDLRRIIEQSLTDPRAFDGRRIELDTDARDHLVSVANGDARAVLNAVELAVETTPADERGIIRIDLNVAEESIQQRAVLYDKEGDYHFDTISAFIKSMRGSDPDATAYWLARMVYAGEDPRFLFRRMLIFASEDVGLADPHALEVINTAAEAFDRVGLPEGRFHLAQAALYLATAPKSNSVFAFFDALAAIEKELDHEVPNHLKDASRDSESLGHGANYLYPHAFRDHWVAQQYLPSAMHGRVFYQPSDQGRERAVGDEVRRRRELQLAAVVDVDDGQILTTSPEDASRDQWLVRATGEVSAILSDIRQRLFADLRVARHDRVLDLAAGSGLLTWEALRRAPEGGVWSVCRDKTMAVAIREMSGQHLPELERPVVLEGPLTNLGDLLHLHDQDEVRFDVVLARNALIDVAERESALKAVAATMAPSAYLRQAETVPRLSQRLCDLVDLTLMEDEELAARVLKAEETIYADKRNPRVTWEPEDLARMWTSAGLIDVEIDVHSYRSPRRLTHAQLGMWFNPGGELHRTFASYLSRQLEPAELKKVRHFFEERLINRDVEWTTTVAFVRARMPGDTA